MRNPYNILHHELIGLSVDVIDSSHPGYKFSGIIVDETKNTLRIETKESEEKIIPKDCVALNLMLDDRSIVYLDGKLLIGRPEERIKKRYKIKFC